MAAYILCCGGSGGHLTPGIAVAQALTASGHVCKLIISKKAVDSRLSQQYTDLMFVPSPGVAFSFDPLKLLKFFWQQCLAIGFSFRILRKTRPVVVMAFGGFQSLATILVAAILRIPIVLHESNYVPGKVTRFLGRFARRVYLPEGVFLNTIPKDRLHHLGYPLRAEFISYTKEAARKTLGMQTEATYLIILGGSQGATALTQWAQAHFKQIAKLRTHVICLTGLRDIGIETLTETDTSGQSYHCQFIPFHDQMSALIASADCVLARAGAGTIAECVHYCVPMILIPFPFSADAHQDKNAEYIQANGGGLVVPQTQINTLIEHITELIQNPQRRVTMSAYLKKLQIGSSTEAIVKDLTSLEFLHAS